MSLANFDHVRRMTRHYKTRRILFNLFIPVLFFFVLSIYHVDDLVQHRPQFQQKGPLPPEAFNRENKWTLVLQSIMNISNSSEVMVSMLKQMKKQVKTDIETMS